MDKEDVNLLNSFLSDVKPSEVFYLNNGQIIRNLYELSNSLKSFGDGIFNYHVNKDKDDFLAWISNGIGDSELAAKLRKIKDKLKYQEILQNRIEYIEKIVLKQNLKNLKEEANPINGDKHDSLNDGIFSKVIKKGIPFLMVFVLGLVIGYMVGIKI